LKGGGGSFGPGEAEGSENPFEVIAVLGGIIENCANYGFHGGRHGLLSGRYAPLARVFHDERVKSKGNAPVIQVVIGGHLGDDVLNLPC
jgi:hypothetical protein